MHEMGIVVHLAKTLDQTAQEEGPYKTPPVQTGGELLSNPHACGEESKSEHNHEHAQGGLASGAVYRHLGVIGVNVFHIAS